MIALNSLKIRKLLIVELIVIGIVVVLLQLVIYKALTGSFPSPKLEHFNQMILGGFLLGVSTHLIFEVIGANEAWCKFTYLK
jgi:hypothetical protein